MPDGSGKSEDQMRRTPIRISFFAVAAMLASAGCSHNSPAATVKPDKDDDDPANMDHYVLQVMQPPEHGLLEVTEYYQYKDGANFKRDQTPMESMDDGANFESSITQGAQVSFVVSVTFTEDECHDPKDEFYCGPVRLFTDSPLYTKDGKRKEVSVVLKAVMSNADHSSEEEYECGDQEMKSTFEAWQPYFCKYEAANPLTF